MMNDTINHIPVNCIDAYNKKLPMTAHTTDIIITTINLGLHNIRNDGATVLVKDIATVIANNYPYNNIGAICLTLLAKALTINTTITTNHLSTHKYVITVPNCW